MGSAQSIINDMQERDKQDSLCAFQRTSTTPTTAKPMVFEDDADLSVHNEVNHESNNVHLDQSNLAFSFINIHWASFSTGLSTVHGVLISLLLIAGCCYFCGRRQCQSCAHQTELLRIIVAGPPRPSAPLNAPSLAPIPDLLRPFSVYPNPLRCRRSSFLSACSRSFPRRCCPTRRPLHASVCLSAPFSQVVTVCGPSAAHLRGHLLFQHLALGVPGHSVPAGAAHITKIHSLGVLFVSSSSAVHGPGLQSHCFR